MKAVLFLLAFGLAPLFGYAAETTIKGERMELIEKGNEVVFSGGVRLDRGTDTIEANEMRTDKGRQKISATGNVRLYRKLSSTETWRGTGEKGFYNTKEGEGYLEGKKKQAHLVRTEIISSTITRVMEIWADHIDFYEKPESALATGNVRGKTVDPDTREIYEFFSTKAHYTGDASKVVLSGNPIPKVIQTGEKYKKQIEGQVITYFLNEDRMVSEGKAEAVLTDYGDKEKTP